MRTTIEEFDWIIFVHSISQNRTKTIRWSISVIFLYMLFCARGCTLNVSSRWSLEQIEPQLGRIIELWDQHFDLSIIKLLKCYFNGFQVRDLRLSFNGYKDFLWMLINYFMHLSKTKKKKLHPYVVYFT